MTAGRVVAGTPYPIDGIVLHCYGGTIGELCNEMRCRTKSSVITGSYENSFHYGIGAPSSAGPVLQFVEDGNVAWTFGTYKNNTYATVPPPNIAINWPTLQGDHGINTTPDVYTLNIALAIGHIVDATLQGCYECPTASGLEQSQHNMLVQLLAYLAQEYDILIDAEHITFHDLIHCGEGTECPCTDIETLLAEVAAFCPPCPEEAFSAPIIDPNDEILHIYGATDPCCPTSPGCLVKIPWDGCQFGSMADDGTLDNYILGLSQNLEGQWCLTRGCLGVTGPIIGCGTTDDPLRIDLCDWGAYVPDQPATNIVNLLGLDDQGCLIEAPAVDIIQLLETPIAVVDTLTVDLTSSGANGHTLQADVIISAEPNNQIEIKPDGLFVDFTCLDFVDAYPAGDISIILGQNELSECIREDSDVFINRLICEIIEDMAAIPTWLLGKTDAECPVFVAPDIIVAAGLTITGDDCVDVSAVGADYEISLNLAPTQSGVENNLFCLGTGLFVPKLQVQNGFTINHALSGPYDALLTSDIIFSQNPANIAGADLTPGTGGLLVAFTVAPTDCIDIDFTGNILTVTPILAPTQGLTPNILQCIAGQGLYVPSGAGLSVLDTDCIDLNISNGILSATLSINPSGDNQVSCGPGGLYVPIAAGLIANDTDCVNHSLVGGVLSTTLNIAGPQTGVPNILSCLPGQGLYVPETHLTVQDTTCINLTYTSNILTANIIIDPTGDNQAQCLPAGLYVPPAAGLIANDTNCITLNLAGNVLTSTPILAPAQGGIPNVLTCLPDGLYVPEWCDWVVNSNNDCTGGVGADYQVTEFALDPDACTITVNSQPDHAAEMFQDQVVSIDVNGFNDGGDSIGNGIEGETINIQPMEIELTNNHPCRDMMVTIIYSGADAYFDTGLGVAGPHTFYGALLPSLLTEIDGGGQVQQYADSGRADYHVEVNTVDSGRLTWNGNTLGLTRVLTLAPGQILTVTAQSRFVTNNTTVNNAQLGGGSLTVTGVTI